MKKVKILKYYINPITLNILLNKIINWCSKVNSRESKYICVSSVHGASESIYNNKYKIAHNSSNLALADGRPIYWALKLLGKKKVDHLPGYLITDKICKLACEKKFTIGIYGGEKRVINEFIRQNIKKYKSLKFNYLYSPPFRNLTVSEKKKVTKDINKSKIDILFVALGAPKQEIWMFENKNSLKCVMIGIGAALDYLAGTKFKAPLFLEKTGFAWLFRLIIEPRRLFKRYLIANSTFIFLFFIQIISHWFKKIS